MDGRRDSLFGALEEEKAKRTRPCNCLAHAYCAPSGKWYCTVCFHPISKPQAIKPPGFDAGQTR